MLPMNWTRCFVLVAILLERRFWIPIIVASAPIAVAVLGPESLSWAAQVPRFEARKADAFSRRAIIAACVAGLLLALTAAFLVWFKVDLLVSNRADCWKRPAMELSVHLPGPSLALS